MTGIGIAGCDGCGCGDNCPECCAPTSISFWAQYSITEDPEYTCETCPSDVFEIELTSVSCGNSDPWYLIKQCTDPGDCEYVFETEDCEILIDASGSCVTACYKVEYSTPCIRCDPVLDGTTYYSRIDYCIFIAFGRLSYSVGAGSFSYDCAMFVRYLAKFYQGESCETMSLIRIAENENVFDLDIDFDLNVIEHCCGDLTYNPTGASCVRYCTLSGKTFPCQIGQAVVVFGHPEYAYLTLHC